MLDRNLATPPREKPMRDNHLSESEGKSPSSYGIFNSASQYEESMKKSCLGNFTSDPVALLAEISFTPHLKQEALLL